jgi:Zn-finger nucleic acid-binding protein
VHLHCLYCGGERRADDSGCRRCQAEAPSVPCRRCRSQVFAPRDTCICGEPCYAWTAATPEELACPRCHGKLARAELEPATVHVEQCARCLGCFVRTEEFSELVERESHADRTTAPAAFVPPPDAKRLPRQVLLDEVRCPHCAATMERARFAQKASVVIDVCPKHGVWLDAGELPQLLEHVRRSAEGTPEPDAADLADAAHWDRVTSERLVEEQASAARLARAEAVRDRPSTAAIAAGTAIGGPWLGLFIALRGRK